MAYTTINKSSLNMNTKLYTGNGGSNRGITGINFKPDWVWLKTRNKENSHILIDSVRGQKRLRSNTTGAEADVSSEFISFDTDGFTVTEGGANEMNNNSTTYVSWNWKAGTSFTNDASGTGIGSIDSAGSVNNTAGFSIVSWTGTGSAGTIKHGLSTVPKMIIIKNRTDAINWIVYHNKIGNTGAVFLDVTNGTDSGAAYFNNTSPTNSVFSVGNYNGSNGSNDNMIAYCFAEKQGYSKFGSYVGNGNADGTFIYTGMRPSFVMVKRTNGTNSWYIYDAKRDGANAGTGQTGGNRSLRPDTKEAEEQASGYPMDILSNGFKWRGASNQQNGSGDTYIFMAFGQSLVGTNNVPCTAR